MCLFYLIREATHLPITGLFHYAFFTPFYVEKRKRKIDHLFQNSLVEWAHR
jgi:hypothetical protein